MKKPYAVFDIDGTIVRTSLLQQFIKVLVNRGKIDIGPAQEIETMLHDFRQRITDDNFGDYMKRAVDIMFESLPHGMTIKEYEELIDVVVKTSLTHTYVYTRQLIQTLKRNNYFLIAISGSERRLVSTFAKAMGFDVWVGQVEYLDDGTNLTGQVRPLGQPKEKILQTIIDKFNLENTESLAVGDTSSDTAILDMVEDPIVFNPNQALFVTAREKGWMIVLERKDMVYGLTKDGEEYRLKTVNA